MLFESLNPVIPNNSQKCLEDLGLADFLRSHARFVPPAAYRGMSGTNLVTLHIYVMYIALSTNIVFAKQQEEWAAGKL